MMSVPREGEALSQHARLADYKIDLGTGCWEWQKCKDSDGYGLVTIARRFQKAHRAYYVAAYGEIADGYEVHHLCENKGCVNPEHLGLLSRDAHYREHRLHKVGLSIETVAEIRRLGTLPGVSIDDVAAQFGISRHRVKRYWSGRGWADIFPDAVRPMRDCRNCGRPIDPAKNRRTKYCGAVCRAQYHERYVRKPRPGRC